MLHKETGQPYEYSWVHPERHSFVNKMKLKSFQQIRATFSIKSYSPSKKDALTKVRLILNMLKNTLGAYVKVGSDVSLDEATFASPSSYGRNLIYYNRRKPAGKFHYKAFCLCYPFTNIMTNIRFATRNGSDKADPMFERENRIKVVIVQMMILNGTENCLRKDWTMTVTIVTFQ